MECCENRGQCERRGIVGEADSQPPRATEPNELHAADGVLNLLEDVARLGEKFGARRCKPGKTISLSRKQADAHLLFEPGYLFGERRLCDPQPVGGAPEIKLLSRDHEVSEMPKLNVSVPNIIGKTGVANRSRLSCNSHLCHCQLNRFTPELRPQFDKDHLACVIALRPHLYSRSGSKDD